MKRWKLNTIDGEEKKEICVKNDEGKWGSVEEEEEDHDLRIQQY